MTETTNTNAAAPTHAATPTTPPTHAAAAAAVVWKHDVWPTDVILGRPSSSSSSSSLGVWQPPRANHGPPTTAKLDQTAAATTLTTAAAAAAAAAATTATTTLYGAIVAAWGDRYAAARHGDKRSVCRSVVREMRARGVRFLSTTPPLTTVSAAASFFALASSSSSAAAVAFVLPKQKKEEEKKNTTNDNNKTKKNANTTNSNKSLLFYWVEPLDSRAVVNKVLRALRHHVVSRSQQHPIPVMKPSSKPRVVAKAAATASAITTQKEPSSSSAAAIPTTDTLGGVPNDNDDDDIDDESKQASPFWMPPTPNGTEHCQRPPPPPPPTWIAPHTPIRPNQYSNSVPLWMRTPHPPQQQPCLATPTRSAVVPPPLPPPAGLTRASSSSWSLLPTTANPWCGSPIPSAMNWGTSDVQTPRVVPSVSPETVVLPLPLLDHRDDGSHHQQQCHAPTTKNIARTPPPPLGPDAPSPLSNTGNHLVPRCLNFDMDRVFDRDDDDTDNFNDGEASLFYSIDHTPTNNKDGDCESPNPTTPMESHSSESLLRSPYDESGGVLVPHATHTLVALPEDSPTQQLFRNYNFDCTIFDDDVDSSTLGGVVEYHTPLSTSSSSFSMSFAAAAESAFHSVSWENKNDTDWHTAAAAAEIVPAAAAASHTGETVTQTNTSTYATVFDDDDGKHEDMYSASTGSKHLAWNSKPIVDSVRASDRDNPMIYPIHDETQEQYCMLRQELDDAVSHLHCSEKLVQDWEDQNNAVWNQVFHISPSEPPACKKPRLE